MTDPLTVEMLRLYRAAPPDHRRAMLTFMQRLGAGEDRGESSIKYLVECGIERGEAEVVVARQEAVLTGGNTPS